MTPDKPSNGVTSPQTVPRVDARCLSDAQWAPLDGTRPVLLTHALEGTSLPWDPVGWCHRVCTRHREDRVKYSQRSPDLEPGKSRIVEAPLRWVFHEMKQGSHATSSLYMDENLLEEDLRREVLGRLPGPLQEDYFQQFFPKEMPVAPLCFIVGGPGSRSTLHADHLSWTAWNLLLSGRKLWRFYRRGGEADKAFAPSRRVQWGQEVHADGLAANWYSDCDLFCHADASCESFRPRVAQRAQGEIPPPEYEVVQGTGEMIVFPGDWWHQTYHYTTSVAVCAQYCNRRNLQRVLGHILDWCRVPDQPKRLAELSSLPAPEQIRRALELAVHCRCSQPSRSPRKERPGPHACSCAYEKPFQCRAASGGRLSWPRACGRRRAGRGPKALVC